MRLIKTWNKNQIGSRGGAGRALLILFFSFWFLAAATLMAAVFMAPEKIKTLIETKGSAAIQGTIRVGEVKISPWPIGIKLSSLQVSIPSQGLNAQIPRATILVDFKYSAPPSAKLTVLIDQPQVTLNPPADATANSAQTAAPNSDSIVLPTNVSLDLSIDGANFSGTYKDPAGTTARATLSRGTIRVVGPRLADPFEISVTGETSVSRGMINMTLPLSMSGLIQIDMTSETAKVIKSNVNVGGIELSGSGWLQWPTQKQTWQLSTTIPEVALLHTPPALLPGKWKGSILSSFKIEHQDRWIVAGIVQLKNLFGQIAIKKSDIVATGTLEINANTEFAFNNGLTVKTLKSDLQLKDLALSYKDLFTKPAGVPMAFSTDAIFAKGLLHINDARFSLAQLNGSVQGVLTYQPGSQTSLSVKIPKTSLAGFEKILPPLSSMPVQGTAQADLSLKGDLNDPMSISLKINPMLLENVRANVNFKNEALLVKGPVSLNMRAILLTEGPQLKSSNIVEQVDLSGLQIQMADKFTKPAGSPLKADIAATQKARKISIQKGNIVSSAGAIIVKGELYNPQAPKIDLHFNVPKLNLGQLAAMIPLLKPYGLYGTANANLNVNGMYDFKKGYEKSVLNVTGEVGADIPKFIYTSPKPAKGNKSSIETIVAPQPLLPDWPIARLAIVRSKVNLGLVQFNGINIEKVTWNGQLNKGALTGEAAVGKIFNGSVNVTKVETNLAQATPDTDLAFTFKSMRIGEAFDWLFPAWKGLVAGTANGRMAIVAAHPSRRDFLEATKARGETTIKNGQLSSLKFDQMVSEKLAKIPGAGGHPVSTKGTTADIDTKFNFLKSRVNFELLDIRTPEKNQMKADGWVDLDKNVEMKGTIFLSHPPIKGSFQEANADASGRLVVPVKITGNVLKPQINIADDILKQMASKMVRHETNKVKSQFENKARGALQQQVDKNKQQLQDQLKSGLQNMLHK